MRKDDRRLSQDPIVHLKPLPSEVDVKSPTVPVGTDILAFCEQAAAGVVSPVVPSPIKSDSHSSKMKLGLKTPTKGEKSNNNNGEITGENALDKVAGSMKRDEKPVQKQQENRESDASSSLKKEKSFERHERKFREHKVAEKSDLKLKISLGGHGGSPNVKAVKNEETKRHAVSSPSLTTSEGLKVKIKLNSSDQSLISGGYGTDKEKGDTKAQNLEQKPLKMVLKLPTGISSTPPPGEEKERHHHRHKKHKHKDRHKDKEDRYSRKRAHSPGDGLHHSTSRHSSSSHHPPSSKVPRSDSVHLNNTHGNGRHSEGGGSNRNSPALHQVNQSIAILEMAMKRKTMDLQRSLEREQRRGSAPPLPPSDPYPAPPPPPPSDAPPLPPGPPPPPPQ